MLHWKLNLEFMTYETFHYKRQFCLLAIEHILPLQDLLGETAAFR